jgi:hypothetical protein
MSRDETSRNVAARRSNVRVELAMAFPTLAHRAIGERERERAARVVGLDPPGMTMRFRCGRCGSPER